VTELTAERLHYNYAGTELIGYLVRAAGTPRPGVLLIHDARGVSEPMKAIARRIAELGYSVLLVDLWGGGKTPGGDEEIGPLIGGLVSDPESWGGGGGGGGGGGRGGGAGPARGPAAGAGPSRA
jgi:dienelactone hydrolase